MYKNDIVDYYFGWNYIYVNASKPKVKVGIIA